MDFLFFLEVKEAFWNIGKCRLISFPHLSSFRNTLRLLLVAFAVSLESMLFLEDSSLDKDPEAF